MENKYFKGFAFKVDDIEEMKSLNDEIYHQLAINMAKGMDIDMAKTPLIDLLTAYMEYRKLKERISKAQDFIRNESYLNDAEIDELCEILEGDK